MSLTDLIRKREDLKFATAIPAIFATDEHGKEETVARIATVAVANSQGENFDRVAAFTWLVHFTDLDPITAAFSPAVTHAGALACYPDAVAAEPFGQIRRHPVARLRNDEEKTVRAWLAHIGETDEAIISEVLNRYRHDADAREYLIERSAERGKLDD